MAYHLHRIPGHCGDLGVLIGYRGIFSPLDCTLPRPNTGAMLTIDLNWKYFLGVIGTLIALVYHVNERFTRLETNVEWLKNATGEVHG